MAVNPQAISTGEGTGLAKVIKPFKSDYYDKKYAEAKGRKDEAKKGMAAAMSKTPWKVDMPEFQEKVQSLKNFYNENAYNLLSGDFQTQVDLDAMQNELINFAAQSKADEKYWNLNNKLINEKPLDYTEDSAKVHQDYARTPLAQRQEYRFMPNFDELKFNQLLATDMSKIQVNQGMPYQSGDIWVQRGKADPKEVEANAVAMLESARKQYGDKQVDDYIQSIGGMDKYLTGAKAMVEDEVNWKLESKGYTNPYTKDGLENPFNFDTGIST